MIHTFLYFVFSFYVTFSFLFRFFVCAAPGGEAPVRAVLKNIYPSLKFSHVFSNVLLITACVIMIYMFFTGYSVNVELKN